MSATNKLTDTALRKLKLPSKNTKLFDREGLYLLVTPQGHKKWRFKCYFEGKEKCLALGHYPHTTLSMARESRNKMRTLIADGVDPSQHRAAYMLLFKYSS